MITTITDATVTVELRAEPQAAPDSIRFASLIVTNHAGRIAVTLDRTELRELIGDAVAVWCEIGQP